MKLKLFHSTVLLFSLFSAAASAQDDAVAVDRGQKTFMRVGCYECHGTDGKGNEAGTALTPDTLPPEAIANFIRFSPGRMPVYPEEVLSDAEIEDIVAFLESVPPSPDADDIDILKGLTPEGE
ncbi:MAG: cytochrome c [Rhodospirillaceae bacterium]|jgi:mono/diheme cytochrome c family protein|nr:cytochrome c [Rhodospirillaceae bacterium]MBT5239728.1 cytochrome c [Rhodospirillaceae bacterium]MBT5567242.1 cytochrome c [Rhodospirillaceae bacterium]MBT7450040.1 cytochrome c [Rhodospirillaceae bacterium]